jgi:AcrR family transcriptional regulator
MSNRTLSEPRKPARRRPDAEATRLDILNVAREEFAEHGLSGARVDAIAARTRTTKRMIYYYFGSKEGLYIAALEDAYRGIRTVEQNLDLATLPPVEALRRLTEFSFDYHAEHPEFVRIVCIENIHHGAYLARSSAAPRLNSSVIGTLADILARGQAAGLFRTDLDPVEVHMFISAFCFYRVSNRYTFGQNFGIDLISPALRARHRDLLGQAVLRFVSADPSSIQV